jgi:hypothetical protein
MPLSDPEKILLEDEFWLSAFDPRDPFRDELVTEFRRGVIFGVKDDLKWGYMAIPSIADAATGPLIKRLIELACLMPLEIFVDSLVFFLSNPKNELRLQKLIAAESSGSRNSLFDRINELQSEIRRTRSEDFSNELNAFKRMLQ